MNSADNRRTLGILSSVVLGKEFANTVDPDETAHNEPSHLDLQCLPSSL